MPAALDFVFEVVVEEACFFELHSLQHWLEPPVFIAALVLHHKITGQS